MKPNENPECDEIPFELIKYAPETINGQIAEILLLFIRGKLGASRIDCMNKFLRSYVCLHCQGRNRRWQLVLWHLLLILIHFQNYNVMALLRKLNEIKAAFVQSVGPRGIVGTCQMLLQLIPGF